ncbi:MAG: hypothetical protein ACYSTL_03265 [Planctomycetota bacterium]|jgi:hypothetical protein
MKLLSTFAVVLLSASLVLAVSPGSWDHASEADFSKGRFEGTAVSSLGEIRLSPEIVILMGPDAAPQVVSAVVRANGKLYAASGTDPIVYEVPAENSPKAPKVFAELPGAVVTALRWTGKELLVGTGGDGAGIYRVDSRGKVAALWTDESVTYVWAIELAPAGALYAGTGPEGKVFTVDPDGKADLIYESGKLARNILSLASSKDGFLYAGSDEKGLIVQIDPRKKTSRVVLDADENEIAALVIDDSGNVYAATSDAARANAEGKVPPNSAKTGKPDTTPAPEPTTRPIPDSCPAENDREENSDDAQQNADADEVIAEEGPTLQAAFREDEAEEEPPEEKEDVPEPPAPSIKRPPAPRPRPGRGNAVYVIRGDGLVETLFRRPVTILGMLLDDNRLYLATGNGGVIYSVTTDGEQIVQLADTDAKQVTSLAGGDDGEVFFATANKGSVGKLARGAAKRGTFVSDVLDAGQIARWGTMQISARTEYAANVMLATRSGNVAEADDATWSSWSEDKPVVDGFLGISSPAGRFLQYRLTLLTATDTSPVVQRVRIIYQVGNLRPVITAVTVKPSDKGKTPNIRTGGAKAFRHVVVKGRDANGDKLSFTIELREVGTGAWIEIAEDHKKPKYVWDTRTLADGTYEIRVKASDLPSNTPATALSVARISELIVVDNTVPVVSDLGAKLADGKVVVSGLAADASSRIVSLHYSVDSQDEWTVLEAKDGICDSDSERFAFELTDLKAGAHRIAVKVTDFYGNVGYASLGVTVSE